MRENDVRKLFEPFALDEEKKEELWTQISNRGEQTEAEDGSLIVSKQRRLRGWHRAVAAAAIVLLLWGAGAAVNAATGGNLAKQIREWFRQAADPQTEQDIVEEAVTIGSKTGKFTHRILWQGMRGIWCLAIFEVFWCMICKRTGFLGA